MSSPAVYNDFGGIASLRAEARRDGQSAQTRQEVARQFEAIFIQTMLKEMRAAVPEGGLFDSEQMRMYQQMFDQQIALDMARGKGLGMSEMIERQLGGGGGGGGGAALAGGNSSLAKAFANPFAGLVRAPAPTSAPRAAATTDGSEGDTPAVAPGGFVRAVHEHAAAAARRLGIAPEVLIAQAALETGWGQKIIRRADGSSSFNFFGIKAGGDWRGERVVVPTLEYRDGVAVRERAEFRAYGSAREAFADYAELLHHPRYAQALASQGDSRNFVEALQAAGYATDPAYAEKITGVLARIESEKATLLSFKESDAQSLTP